MTSYFILSDNGVSIEQHLPKAFKWETGKRMPDTDMLRKIAQFFNVSIDYLLDNEKSPSEESEELDNVYFSLAKDAQQNGIDPDDIRLAIETIKSMKNRKAGDQP